VCSSDLFVRIVPCCAPVPNCNTQSVAHHSTVGRGKSQKSDDDQAMGLCPRHHADFHALSGPFKGWEREQIREWQQEMVVYTQTLHFLRELRLGRFSGEVPAIEEGEIA
jgi:hypothetical protein